MDVEHRSPGDRRTPGCSVGRCALGTLGHGWVGGSALTGGRSTAGTPVVGSRLWATNRRTPRASTNDRSWRPSTAWTRDRKDGWVRAGLSDAFSSEDRRRGLSFPKSDVDSYARSVG